MPGRHKFDDQEGDDVKEEDDPEDKEGPVEVQSSVC